MMQDLWMYYEQNRGDLDGRQGWLLAWLSGQYRWLSHAKLIDLGHGDNEPEAVLHPESLDDVIDVMKSELERLRGSKLQVPQGIVWRSPIWDPSGYADEGRCIAKALSLTNRHVVLEDIPWSDSRCEIADTDRALLLAMQRGKRAGTNLAITNCIPTLATPDRAAAINVIRTTFETDRIPDSWIPHLEAFDEVWVISNYNREAFVHSGIAPERIRVVPSFLDTDLYTPEGSTFPFTNDLKGRFVFLSVFDWQYRKGWDVLLKAYCQTFSRDDQVGLLLKISRADGRPLKVIFDQADQVLQSFGQRLAERNDIVIRDDRLSATEMAELYRSVDAFVLASRGEGWGRPYMEAMACGLPTIGTGASGNIDFMDSENSVLVPAELVDVPDLASREIPPYSGHRWFEPNERELSNALLKVANDTEFCQTVSARAIADIQQHHDLNAGRAYFDQAIEGVLDRFRVPERPPVEPPRVRVNWEGEFFAGHSFANVNERLIPLFDDDKELALSVERKFFNPANDLESPNRGKFQLLFETGDGEENHVVVRHAFPPNWEPPASGRWIHIQPWEFGHLPVSWIEPLKNRVDEIWVPTQYVRKVYENSGIPGEKIFVIPWGIDPHTFSTDAIPRLLPTKKSFRFLFVGGTIERKGYDRVLQAYLEEFSGDDDVCLVVKDLGTQTFYRYGNLRQETLDAMSESKNPEILYFDQSWTPGQIAGLYAACDCLVMPYRGEGFGLPVLEAMACGTPAIVPKGGATDDFVDDTTGILLSAGEVETSHDWPLAGPALELDIDIDELRSVMRQAFENRSHIEELGKNAAQFAQGLTWQNTFTQMKDRILENVNQCDGKNAGALRKQTLMRGEAINNSDRESSTPGGISAIINAKNDEATIGTAICSIAPFVDSVLVVDDGSSDRSSEIAREYGAILVGPAELELSEVLGSEWYFSVPPNIRIDELAAKELRSTVNSLPSSSLEVTIGAKQYRIDEPNEDAASTLKILRRETLNKLCTAR